MSDQLDFTLPDERPRRAESPKGRGLNNFLLFLILIAVVGLGAATLLRGGASSDRRQALDLDGERALATKLQHRGLNESAAEAWLRYLAAAKLDPKERGTIYYGVGKLYQEAGDFQKALVNYYRSEAAAEVDELKLELNQRKRECFRRLGNIAGLNRELEAMTALTPAKSEKETAGDVVAEIGPQKITTEDVNRRIDQLVELQLKQFSAYLGKEELNKRKEKLVDQFQSNQAKFAVLQDMVTKEVLLREAIKRGLDKKPENDEAIEEFRTSFLANRVLDAETEEKVNITESDLRDYYEAHKQDFREKARVEISQIVADKEEDAEAALQRLKEGKSFEECAKELSTDENAKKNGGKVEEEIEKGGDIPGIGRDVDVHSHLFSLKENEASPRPVKVGDKFYIFKVRKLIPERVKAFEEVRSEVEQKKTQEKVQEVREGLIERLQSEHGAIIHRSKFVPEKPEGGENPEEEKKGTAPVPRGTK